MEADVIRKSDTCNRIEQNRWSSNGVEADVIRKSDTCNRIE